MVYVLHFVQMSLTHTCSKCGQVDPLAEREAIIARLNGIVHDPEEKSMSVIIGGEKILREFANDRKEGVGAKEKAVYRPEYMIAKLREVTERAALAQGGSHAG